MHRSKTAEHLFRERFETRSAGLWNESPVTKEQLEWADFVIVMEDGQKSEIGRRFPDLNKRVISLNIPDIFKYNDRSLVTILKSKIDSLF